MKKVLIPSLLASALFFGGCASSIPQGVLFTDVQLPVAASNTILSKNTKVGKSYCKSYLGMVTQGDASIEAAKKNGGITKVISVDWKAKSILGLIGEYECIVTGE